MGFVDTVEKYAPGRAAQLRARSGRRTANSNTNAAASYAMSRAANTVANAANSAASSGDFGYDEGNEYANTANYNAKTALAKNVKRLKEKAMQDVMSLSGNGTAERRTRKDHRSEPER